MPNPTLVSVLEYPSHHQMPLASAFREVLGERFRAACVAPVWAERRAMGWADEWEGVPWLLRPWETAEAREEFREWVDAADVVIFPTYWSHPPCPELMRERVRRRKLTFAYSEPRWRSSSAGPRLALSMLKHRLLARSIDKEWCHFLAVGAYAAGDERKIGMFRDRAWTYGYFVPVADAEPPRRSDSVLRILWAGRMIWWKRLDLLIRAVAGVVAAGRKVELQVIGDGPLRGDWERLAASSGCASVVQFTGPLSPAEVVAAMAKADVFVLPSNFMEGWGVVVNEAMGQGCTVVASDMAGATRVLIEDEVDGLHFRSGDQEHLQARLLLCCDDRERVRAMGKAARATIRDRWSPQVGAARLLELFRGLLGMGPMPKYAGGVGARAENNRYRRETDGLP